MEISETSAYHFDALLANLDALDAVTALPVLRQPDAALPVVCQPVPQVYQKV
jgi:hypothetical protein